MATHVERDELKESDVLTEGPRYNAPAAKTRIKWRRCYVPREALSQLNKRSDLLGFAQTLGFLATLFAAAGGAIYSFYHGPWYLTALLVFINGHLWHFLINGFHELVHDSVFRTRWLNGLFLRLFSFLGWYNHHHFWASHTEHHKYTLHPPDDLEVVLPIHYDMNRLWRWGIVNRHYPIRIVKSTFKLATGRIPQDRWTQELFPESDPHRRRAYSRWARILLAGHLAIAAGALAMGCWIVPLVITFPMTFGGWLHFLCNSAQHTGLKDNVPDFRVCCRTIYLNPVLRFLYWHMNYHTEHHMYAAVPCYRLGKLHRLIQAQMPPCPNGLWQTWTQIMEVTRRQKQDPTYQYEPQLPPLNESTRSRSTLSEPS